eukprot:1254539-Rhodomonas_salina.5
MEHQRRDELNIPEAGREFFTLLSCTKNSFLALRWCHRDVFAWLRRASAVVFCVLVGAEEHASPQASSQEATTLAAPPEVSQLHPVNQIQKQTFAQCTLCEERGLFCDLLRVRCCLEAVWNHHRASP